MNPYQSRSMCGGKAKRRRKQSLTDTKVEIKQEVVVKDEPNDTTIMVEVTRLPPTSPMETSDMIKSETEEDSEMYFKNYNNCIKKEDKSEDECPKKGSAIDASSNVRDEVGDAPINGNVNSPGQSSNNESEKKKREIKGKKPGDQKKETNVKASKKVKRQKKHTCHSCGYATSHKPNFAAHIRAHTGEKPFVCKVCAKSFTQKSNLNLHVKIHKGIKPFECSICSKVFSRNSHLRYHLRIHTKRLAFACLKCGQRFAEENQKQSHEKRCSCRRLECYLCQYDSFVRTNLKSHMRSKHTGEKPFECAVCDMKFCQNSSLKQHLATHAKPRPIRCSKCWKRFTEEDKKNSHEGQCNRRLHQCYLCKFNANNSTCLKFHMQSKHTGEWPFPCQYCEARFVQKLDADRHMKRCHNLKN